MAWKWFKLQKIWGKQYERAVEAEYFPDDKELWLYGYRYIRRKRDIGRYFIKKFRDIEDPRAKLEELGFKILEEQER